jgi:tetratricopeptide (TPR) repeat protein
MWAAAAELWEQVTERNPVNGDNWIRLAEARFALKDYPAAVRAHGRLADLGVRPLGGPGAACSADLPYPSPGEVAYRIACCHAGLGDRERAVGALGEALSIGFRDLGRAREDDLWEALPGGRSRARDAGHR